MQGSLSPCPFCDGQGLITFAGGPAVEPCTECGGVGQIFSDPTYRGVFAALLRQKGVLLDADMRLLLLALAEIDRRLQRLEDASRER